MTIIKTDFEYSKPLIPLDLSNIQYIDVHHSEAATAKPEEIHEWHKENGWAGIGYNEYIRKNGTVYICRGDFIGAHTAGYNSKTYGICCEGNYNIEVVMPEAQKQSLVERIQFNRDRFPNYKLTVPHSRLTDTECPGRKFPMSELLKRIEVIKVTLEEAIELQIKEGVINSPDYRKKVCDTVMYEKDYVVNVSNKLLEKNNEIERLKLLIK